MQGHALPGERQQSARLRGLLADERGRVEHGVEKSRVQTESAGRNVLGQLGLDEHLVAASPGSAQAPEHRAVRETVLRPCLVEAVEVQGPRLGGRPRRELKRLRRAVLRGECAGGVLRPGQILLRRVRAGVDADGTAAVRVRSTDGDLDPHGLTRAEEQGHAEGQLLDQAASDLLPRAQHQFQERGRRQQHIALHRVIGEPGLRTCREAPGEDHPVGLHQRHDSAEQRVPDGLQPQGHGVLKGSGDGGPVVPALEGVGGGVGETGAGAGEEGRPVHGDAVREEPGQGREGGRFLGPVLAQRRDDDRVFGRQLFDQGGEGAVGAEFQEAGDALGGEGADAVGEADCATDVSDPVVRRVRGGEGAREVRDERDMGLGEVETGDRGAEVLQHRIHQRGVEGVGDPQAGGAAAGQGGGHRENGFLRAGEHQGGGAVDRRDAHLVGEVRDDVGFRGLDREHQATHRQRLHQPRPRRHQRTRVSERQHTRDMSGGDLTDRMTGHVVRP
ncbi:hypothetical protein GCM10010344_79260 [Streptomyces bluensis]|nr:hypothetical protein GCM10010344_79260 [Streptomyces bluensis]